MNVRRALAAALVTAAAALPATPAAGAGFRSLGPAAREPTVGWSDLAWKPGAEVLRVRDSRTARYVDVAIAATCEPYDVDPGMVLLGCQEGSGPVHPYLVDTASRATRLVSGADVRDSYAVLGRHWLGGGSCAINPPVCDSVALNFRTGERVTGEIDLDFAGVRPRPERPRMARIVGREITSPGPRAELRFRRRGRRDVLLSRCRGGCYAAQYSFGRVAWLEGRRVHGFEVRSRRRSSWRLPSRLGDLGELGLGFTAYEVVLVAPSAAGSGAELFSAGWRTVR